VARDRAGGTSATRQRRAVRGRPRGGVDGGFVPAPRWRRTPAHRARAPRGGLRARERFSVRSDPPRRRGRLACARPASPGVGGGGGVNPRLFRSRRLGSIVDAVGNTPLLRLRRVAESAPSVEVYIKLEFANPGGSVKDRPALRMIRDAIADGRLTHDKI